MLTVTSVVCLFAGLQSGFVTLPRLSRLPFQGAEDRRDTVTDSGGFTLKRSDSLTSFNVDLGPSLMSEMLDLMDNPSYLQKCCHSQSGVEEEEEEREEQEEEVDLEEEEDDISLTETPVPSPAVTSPSSSVGSGSFVRDLNNRGRQSGSSWPEQDKGRRSEQSADAGCGSPQRAEPVMEPERFQRAADVLSRHYGGGSISERPRRSSTFSTVSQHCKSQYSFSGEEEEIKV